MKLQLGIIEQKSCLSGGRGGGGEREARGEWCAHQVIWVTAWEKLFNPLSDCRRNEFTFPPLHHYWQDSKSSLCFLLQSRGSRSGPFHVSLIFKFFIPVTILSCMAITKISLVTMKFWQLLHSHVLNSDSQPRDQGSSFHLLYDWKSVAVKSKCGSTHLSSDGILKHSGGRTFHTRNVRFVFCWHPPANIKKQTQCECAQVIWFLSSPSPTSNT